MPQTIAFIRSQVLAPCLLILLAHAVAPASAQTFGRSSEAAIEAECKLKSLRGTKSSVARGYLGKACNFMSLPSANLELSRQERIFHACILDVLPGTEDDRNAVELANACRDRAWAN